MLISQNLIRAASLYPSKIAVRAGTVERTWAELRDRVERLAGALGRLELSVGERIAVLSNNTTAFHELYFAAPWSGLVMACLNTRWSKREALEALRDCAASALLTDAQHLAIARELVAACPTIRNLFCCDPATPGELDWQSLANAGPGAPACTRSPGDIAYIFYTGGTTGQSKGVALTELNLATAGLSMIQTSGIFEPSSLLVNVPLFHMSGGGLVNCAAAAAASVTLLPRFDPEEAMRAVTATRATHVVWVPTMLAMILESPNFASHDLSSLERIIYGSAPMPRALLRRAMAALPRVSFTQYYGMTETTGTGVSLAPADHFHADTRRLESAGRAVPGMTVKIVRPDGSDAARNERGEICFAGPLVMSGYWNRIEQTCEAVRDGWLHSGDVGFLDDDGYVFVVDRLKDMIISGGENVYSTEVEQVLYTHPSVGECAVIGLPDPKWGELVCAVVFPTRGAATDEAELQRYCRMELGGYKVPRRIIVVDEPLPKSAAGKILKGILRDRYASEA